MSKTSRSGGKFCGTHTTLISAAMTICDIAVRCPYVTKISPGFITAGLPSAQGKRRVKITDDGRSILLLIRDNTSKQEVRIFVSNMQEAKLALARGVRNSNMHLSFTKN